MKGAVLLVEVGQDKDAARFQAVREFFQDGRGIGKVMEGHGREDQVEVLAAVLMMQVEVPGEDIGDPPFGDLGPEGLQHAGGGVGCD
jgi:hypothetical protein